MLKNSSYPLQLEYDMFLSPRLFRSFSKPRVLNSSNDNKSLSDISLRFFSISEIEPKQAKPAFFVVAPIGKIPLSINAIFEFLFSLAIFKAVKQPTIPAPITT